jgi:glycerol-3-phosphate dehydrogenase subunit B
VDVLVIGGGLAGLTCAMVTSLNKKTTRLITKGWGSLYWDSGCIDLLGHLPNNNEKLVDSPINQIKELILQNPTHPYALTDIEIIIEAIEFLKSLSQEAGYPLEGTVERNWLIPTALGSIHPTCLAPFSMIAGDIHNKDPMLIVGIEGYHDFYPEFVSGNLNNSVSESQDYTIGFIKNHRFINSLLLARLFESEEFRDEVVQAIKPIPSSTKRIGIPAILGIYSSRIVHAELEEKLGYPIFEIPGIPPSIPGIRLNNLLLNQISLWGGKVYDGLEAVKFEASNHQLRTIYSEAAARVKPHRSNKFVLATGEFLGGGLRLNHAGKILEPILDLPIVQDSTRMACLIMNLPVRTDTQFLNRVFESIVNYNRLTHGRNFIS